MPNKYEREIEEILRNLERTEPKTGFGRKGSRRVRRPAGARRSMPPIRLTFSDWCLLIACIAGVTAGGWAFAQHRLDGGGNVITGIIALIGAVCIVIVAVSPFFARPRYSSPSGRYNTIPRIHSNPFSRLGTRWHLLLLKLRYRKGQGRER